MSIEEKNTNRSSVTVRVEAEQATRFNVGTRWEVVTSSLESLWQGAYKVTFEEITAENEDG